MYPKSGVTPRGVDIGLKPHTCQNVHSNPNQAENSGFFSWIDFFVVFSFRYKIKRKKNIHSKRWRNQPIWVIYWLGYNWTSIKQLLWYWVMNMRRRMEKKKMGYKREKKNPGLVFKCCFLYQAFRSWLFSHLCGSATFWMLFIPCRKLRVVHSNLKCGYMQTENVQLTFISKHPRCCKSIKWKFLFSVSLSAWAYKPYFKK